MHKRDYQNIADVLNSEAERMDTKVERRVIASVARTLADEFKDDNSRFRYDTFFAACGLDPFGDVLDDE